MAPIGANGPAAAAGMVTRLAGVIAPEKLLADPLMTYAYSGDASAYRMVPALVAIVDTEAQVASLLAAARAEGLPVTFRAAGTSLCGQAVTDGVLAVLGDGFRTMDVSPDATRITLGPSVIVAHANRALKPFDRKIGPDPASMSTCKVGGVVANNSSGMCCGVAQNTYHTMARLRVMLADGTVLDSGDAQSRADFAKARPDLLEGLKELHREVMGDAELRALIERKYRIKNTVGYALNALTDFHDPIDILIHLIVGSEGTLGFVSEVTYNTVDDHPFKATALVPYPDAHACARGIIRAGKSGVSAAEFIERRALATVEHKPAMIPLVPLLTPTSPAVLVEVAAPDAAALDMRIRLVSDALAAEGALSHPAFFTDPDQQNALWDIRRGFGAVMGAIRPKGTAMLSEDVAAPIERLADFVTDLRTLLDRHGYEDAIIFGHALAGNLHFQLNEDFSTEAAVTRLDAFSRDLSHLVSIEHQGSMKAEHGTGRAIAAFVEAEWGPKAYRLMHRIKALFDPENMLNPGVLLNADEFIHIRNLKTMTEADPIVDLCIECGLCEPACPSTQMTLTPRQRISVARERARLEVSGDNPERLAAIEKGFGYNELETCAACNLCSLRCPVGIETGTMVLGERARRRTAGQKRLARVAASTTGIIERSMQFGFGAADLSRSVLGNRATDAIAHGLRKGSGDRVPRVSRALRHGPGAPRDAGRTPLSSPMGKVVYFPSCATRMFGAPETEFGLLPTPEAMVALLRRAGFDPVVPKNLTGLCCGQPFLSKGFPEEARKVGGRLDRTIDTLSEGGKLVVFTDASTCAKHMDGHDGPVKVVDSPEFLLAEILPRLTITEPLDIVAVHHNCSAQRLGEQRAIEALAAAAAKRIAVLSSVTCCGYAGDKGLVTPELNAHATRFVRNDIPADCRLGVSTVSTCASGLTEHAAIPFVSLASLLERVSRPQ
ncbi:FAD-binding and (Fe-S)-binding domain-containing protein [Arsenicitalea aurantiaca]|nr:FAD-binding and (Fe-S)-binding domain-containing protein [Arsenicitalea aurantiaca]